MKCVFLVIDHYITTIFIKLVEDLSAFFSSPVFWSRVCMSYRFSVGLLESHLGLPDMLCVHVRLIGGFFFLTRDLISFVTDLLTKKLINSQSKKEVENFICSNLRIITWETDSLSGLSCR